jgi:hypothetical protein
VRVAAVAFVVIVAVSAAGGEPAGGEADAAALAALIDGHIETQLESERVTPARRADDAEFLRRVYLDVHGVIPTADEARRFLDDADPNRRARLIETLLASSRYGEYLADLWQGYLVSPLADDPRRADQFRTWLADQFNTKSWDRVASELLTATGKIEENPAVIYLIESRLPRTVPDLTDLTSRYFLGIRLSCAQCHDHPFVEWTQQDYWGMAAFFSQVQTPGRAKQVYRLGVRDDPAITLASLVDAGNVDGFMPLSPTVLGGEELSPHAETTSRAALAAWMTSPENEFFARAMVNRTWWRFFGRGLVEPVDDMHAANPASHPELLDLLSEQFIESGFDLKFLSHGILMSRAYQRTSQAGDEPEKQAALFGRMSVKVLSPGQLYDSLVTIFGPPAREKGRDVRHGARREFTEFFATGGDPDPTEYRRGIPHLLRLMNSRQVAGPTVAELAAQLARPGRTADEIAGDLFLTILGRRPTAGEQELFHDHVEQAGSLAAATGELAWALTKTSEFVLNH